MVRGAVRMKKHICTALFLVFALSTLTFAAQANPDKATAELNDYDVCFIDLDRAVKKSVQGKTVEYDEGYLVRLYGKFPTRTAKTMELYIGSERILEYGGTPDGLYFIIYEKSTLEALSGKPFQYRFGTGDIKPLRQKFDPDRFKPFVKKSEREALTDK